MRKASRPPRRSTVLSAFAETRSRTERPSASEMSVTLHRLGRNRRLVLRFEWLTLWPTRAPLPVNSQRRAIAEAPCGLAPLGVEQTRGWSEVRGTYRGRGSAPSSGGTAAPRITYSTHSRPKRRLADDLAHQRRAVAKDHRRAVILLRRLADDLRGRAHPRGRCGVGWSGSWPGPFRGALFRHHRGHSRRAGRVGRGYRRGSIHD